MNRLANDDGLLRRYLLGEVTDEERERAEDRLLRDAAVLEDLDDLEDDLTESYLAGTLSPEERTQFEGHFLQSAAHRRQLEASRTLRESLAARTLDAPARPVVSWRLALAAAAIVILVLTVLLWPRRPPAPGGGELARSVPPSPSGPPPSTLTAGGEVILALMPGQAMGSGGRRPEVTLGPGIERVRLELLLEHDAVARCQARIGAGGRELWQNTCQSVRTPEGSMVVLEVPASRLLPGTDHQVTLSSGLGEHKAPVGTYWFRVSPPRHSP